MPPIPDAIRAKVLALWLAKKTEVREKIDILERAAATLEETRTIDDSLRDEATSVAHKLAGSLGMFGHDEATEVARAIELDLENPGLPQPERLRDHVTRLESLLADDLSDD